MKTQSPNVRPACPFCSAAWTDEMLARYDSMSSSGGCSCCGGAAHDPLMEESQSRQMPADDLCCDSCGKPIYLAPAAR